MKLSNILDVAPPGLLNTGLSDKELILICICLAIVLAVATIVLIKIINKRKREVK
ncbi:MAG: hypothetical protein IJK67_02745 [Bacilli bacterium]|nr:hypothetical protein [Bacilli bacterium]